MGANFGNEVQTALAVGSCIVLFGGSWSRIRFCRACFVNTLERGGGEIKHL